MVIFYSLLPTPCSVGAGLGVAYRSATDGRPRWGQSSYHDQLTAPLGSKFSPRSAFCSFGAMGMRAKGCSSVLRAEPRAKYCAAIFGATPHSVRCYLLLHSSRLAPSAKYSAPLTTHSLHPTPYFNNAFAELAALQYSSSRF